MPSLATLATASSSHLQRSTPPPALDTKKKPPHKRKRTSANDAIGLDDKSAPPRKHRAVLSKFEQSARVAERIRKEQPAEGTEPREEPEPDSELHGLVPLPQPDPIREAPYEPTFSYLPTWLAEPIIAPANVTKPFDELNIHPRLVRHLKSKGYHAAFAVQSAVLPLLLPGASATVADLCVSATTGSGKTLAYLLPMIESLRHRVATKLRGVIIVPTRELVSQVREVAELCAFGTGLKVGTAAGNRAFALEQDLLIKRGRRYDPAAWAQLQAEAKDQLLHGWSMGLDYVENMSDLLPHHIPQYESKVDILVCTPGRLVEHIQNTRVFHLDDLDWLVIDEADRLLDERFQGWVETVMSVLDKEQAYAAKSAREKVLSHLWNAPPKRSVRKVVLSATMTRDLSKLGSLKLRRPTLVVAEGIEKPDGQTAPAEVYGIPSTLDEWTIPVGVGSYKPLFLIKLLRGQLLSNLSSRTPQNGQNLARIEQAENSDVSLDAQSTPESTAASLTYPHANEREYAIDDGAGEPVANVLIFTHSNENAHRLSRLLSLLYPPYAGVTGMLTKSLSTTSSRKTLRAFRANKLRILIASDRASRGLDLPNLAHIVNYDIPTSVKSYVHRIGRTARAGAPGVAWTLLTESEAGWFWNVVARGESVERRGRKVKRMKLPDVVTEEATQQFEHALQILKEEARCGGNG